MRDKLRLLPYFAEVSDQLLDRVAELSDEVDFADGTVIIDEGATSEEMYVVVAGELIVTKHSEAREVELARIGPGNVFGEIALLDSAPRTATVTAHGETKTIRVPAEAFEELLSDPGVVRRMFGTVTARLRGIEDVLRHEERMAALGRMAAQLMHELNNPAAAVARSTKELARLQEEMSGETRALGAAFGGPEIAAPKTPEGSMTALERGDLEDEVSTWLQDLGILKPWDLAPALVAAGWTRDALDAATAHAPEEARASVVRWIGLAAATDQMLDELGIGASRISELVRVVKDYSFLDRGPIQDTEPTKGIEDTLILLKHKLQNIEVTLDFGEDLHQVQASGRDLNQVWTNLIDNAADAMDPDGGHLSISARNEGDQVAISIADTGPGIPDEKVTRIFDPFFTTKEPGHGTGLGLHTVHNIVARSGGQISVDTSPSGTTFEVRLPAVT